MIHCKILCFRLRKVVCPSTPKDRQFAVHVFSEEWFGHVGGEMYLEPPRPPSFLMEFIARESGAAALNWLEISRSRSSLLQQLQIDYTEIDANGNESSVLPADWECPYRCPELNACISSSLWCDGRPNCPSGYDELEGHCGVGRQLLAYLPTYAVFGGIAAGIAAFCLFLVAAVLHRLKLSRRRRRLGKTRNNLGPHRIPTEEMLIDPSSSTTSS